MDRRLLAAAFLAACVLGTLCLPWLFIAEGDATYGERVEIRTDDGKVSDTDAAEAGRRLAVMHDSDPDSVPVLRLDTFGSPDVGIPRELMAAVADTGSSIEVVTGDGRLTLPAGSFDPQDIRGDTVSVCLERTGSERGHTFYIVSLEQEDGDFPLSAPAEVVLVLDPGTATEMPTVCILGNGPGRPIDGVMYSEVGGTALVAFETDRLSEFSVFRGVPAGDIDWIHELLMMIGLFAVFGLVVPAVWWIDGRLSGKE